VTFDEEAKELFWCLRNKKVHKKYWEDLIAYFSSMQQSRKEDDAFKNSSLPRERVYKAVA
jgi:hypothetical protein